MERGAGLKGTYAGGRPVGSRIASRRHIGEHTRMMPVRKKARLNVARKRRFSRPHRG